MGCEGVKKERTWTLTKQGARREGIGVERERGIVKRKGKIKKELG